MASDDNVGRCIAKIIASLAGGEDELDKIVDPNVTIRKVSPDETGFPAWKRCEEYVQSTKDRDRGHADWVVPSAATDSSPRILYCHGGGYEHYSPQDVYRPVTSRLAVACGMPVLAFDYRLTPEFRHPAQLEDAVQAFRWIGENGPNGPGKATAVFLAGDSAGGGLALALAIKLRDEPVGDVRVAGITVISPETDLTCSGESYTTRRWVEGGGHKCDPMFRDEDPTAASLPQIYKLLGKPGEAGSFKTNESSISPLHASLHGLPPTQIQVGDAEVMLSDSVEFGRKALAAGSPRVEVTVWPRMWHTFTQFADGCGGDGAAPLEEALEAVRLQGCFLKELALIDSARL